MEKLFASFFGIYRGSPAYTKITNTVSTTTVHENMTKLTPAPDQAMRGFIMSSVAEPLAIAPNQIIRIQIVAQEWTL